MDAFGKLNNFEKRKWILIIKHWNVVSFIYYWTYLLYFDGTEFVNACNRFRISAKPLF